MKKFELNKRTLFSSTGLLITLAALLIINILASLLFSSARLDLTENKLYTLSDGTKNILKKIDEPITLRLYFSESVLVSVPGIMTYGQRVKELLQEYENYADGNVNLIIADPEPFSDEEDQAVQYGLQGVPLDAGGTQAYFGLVGTNAVDDEEVIAFFQPNKEQSLEYDITKLVNKLMSPKQKVVGLMSSLPLISAAPQMPFAQNGPSGDWTIVTQLKQFFKVEPLQIDTESIPDNIDVLMLVHPKTLSDKTQYAIDQFVLNGGRAIVFVDPHSEADEPPGRDPQNPFANMNVPRNSSLDKLFAAWGIELSDGLVALDRRAATRVNAMVGRRPQPIDYVAWLTLDKTNFSDSDFVTSELKNLAMGTVGVLKKVDEATTEFTPLLKTSEQGSTIQNSRFQFGPDPMGLLRDYKPGTESIAIAARISGTVNSAFAEAIEGADKNKHLKSSKENINIIVVADTDMLNDQFWVNVQNFFGRQLIIPRANNDAFLINSIDNLSGNNDLISLRTRAKSARPFDKVAALKEEAEQRFRDKEQALQSRLRETEQKLAQLQRNKDTGDALILSQAQQQELERFRAQQVSTRKELRQVQHGLNSDIEDLGAWLKFLNIVLVPIFVTALAAGITITRRRKLHRQNAGV